VGGQVQVVYSATVNPDGGNGRLPNAVTAGPDGGCDPDAVCDTTTDVTGDFTVAKSVDKTTVAAGDTVTWTVTVTNTGRADVTGSFSDDLSDVLDDATLGALPEGASLDGTTLSWSGLVAVGGQVQVSYSATVNPDGGNGRLPNAVTAGPDGQCDPDAVCDTTTDLTGDFTVAKSVDKTVVAAGDTVTWTVTVTNTGRADVTGSFSDDLSDVLDDATLGALPEGATLDGTALS
jgi:uncharacterized repeat protein (TIGR01451 family)